MFWFGVEVAHVSCFFFATANLGLSSLLLLVLLRLRWCCVAVAVLLLPRPVIRKPITFVVLRTWSRRAVICPIRAARRGGLNEFSWRKGETVTKGGKKEAINVGANLLGKIEWMCLRFGIDGGVFAKPRLKRYERRNYKK